MRIRVKVFILGFVLVCLGAMSAYAQEKSDATTTSTPSLGDLARQAKAQKAKEAKEAKPAKVFTNDNLPSPKAGEAEVSSSSPPKSPDDSAPPASGEPAAGHGEKYFRERLSDLQAKLDTDKRELEVLQQKVAQNNSLYYSDPNKQMQQEYSRGDINKGAADIDAKKQQIAADEKAIEDLRDQLRQEGGDPAWLR